MEIVIFLCARTQLNEDVAAIIAQFAADIAAEDLIDHLVPALHCELLIDYQLTRAEIAHAISQICEIRLSYQIYNILLYIESGQVAVAIHRNYNKGLRPNVLAEATLIYKNIDPTGYYDNFKFKRVPRWHE